MSRGYNKNFCFALGIWDQARSVQNLKCLSVCPTLRIRYIRFSPQNLSHCEDPKHTPAIQTGSFTSPKRVGSKNSQGIPYIRFCSHPLFMLTETFSFGSKSVSSEAEPMIL